MRSSRRLDSIAPTSLQPIITNGYYIEAKQSSCRRRQEVRLRFYRLHQSRRGARQRRHQLPRVHRRQVTTSRQHLAGRGRILFVGNSGFCWGRYLVCFHTRWLRLQIAVGSIQ